MRDRRVRRLELIAEALATHGSLHLRDAAEMLGVSEMTVRRDLAAEPGQFDYYGGHIVPQQPGRGPTNYVFDREREAHATEKRRACEAAARLIEPGDTIFLDCGTTTPHLARRLATVGEVTVVCFALNIAEILARLDNVEFILLGGVYRRSSASFDGAEALETLKRIGLNAAFVSAGGVHPEHGATCSNFHEVPLKQEAIRKALRKYLVIDQSKFGRVRPAWFAPLDAFDAVLTEASEPDAPLAPSV